jgi:hypothetical protein
MRVARNLLLAALAVVPVAVAAEVIPPGGQLKTPDEWRWRLDEPATMSPGGKMEAGQWWFVAMPPGWHVTMGPGGVVYHPAYRGSGRFIVDSELFLFPDSSDEGVGPFVGGQSLGDQESPAYTSLLLRKDGSAAVVRRAGGAVTTVANWAAVEGVKPHGGKDAEKHAFRIEADTATVTFLIDGTKVAAIPRADAAAEGHFGLRIGRAVNIHVVRLDFTQQLAPPKNEVPGALKSANSP